jgi:acid phosphatase (class A)
MKPLSLFLISIITSPFVFAQTAQPKQNPVPPAWGHYQKLQQLPASAQAGQEATDARQFELTSAHKQVTDLSVTEVFGYGRVRRPFYLKGTETFSIAPPPANSSAQTKAELNYLLQLQQRRSEEDIRASKYYATVYYNTNTKPGDADYARMQRNLFHIGRSIGTWFNADSLPLTATLAANVWNDAGFVIWKYKNYFLRIRPGKLEPELKYLEETPWAAYPSGHATNSYVNAYLYAALIPEFESFFLKDAYDMAHSREIIGVHYPSDSESGRLLAYELIQRLMKNEQFQKDFAAAKAEIKQIKNTKGF